MNWHPERSQGSAISDLLFRKDKNKQVPRLRLGTTVLSRHLRPTYLSETPDLHSAENAEGNRDLMALRVDADVRCLGYLAYQLPIRAMIEQMETRICPARKQDSARR